MDRAASNAATTVARVDAGQGRTNTVEPLPGADAFGAGRPTPTWDGGRGRDYRYRRGGRLPAAFVAPAYRVSDWGGYGLAPPPANADWVRYFDDAVLVDRAGTVLDARPGIEWTQPARPYDAPPPPEARDDMRDDARSDAPFTYTAGPGTTVTRLANGTTITTTTVTTPGTSTTTVDERP